jgi:hypothetical protein
MLPKLISIAILFGQKCVLGAGCAEDFFFEVGEV